MKCPACNNEISYFIVKEKFSCPYCDKILSSNIKSSSLSGLTIAGLISTAIAYTLFPDGSLTTLITDIVIGLVIFICLQKFTLRLE